MNMTATVPDSKGRWTSLALQERPTASFKRQQYPAYKARQRQRSKKPFRFL